MVLEAGRVGDGTTGRSTAKLSLLQGTQLSTIRSRHPQSVVDAYVEAQREGAAWVRRFCQDHGVAVQHRDAVTYAVHRGRRASRSGPSSTPRRRPGLPVEWVDDLPLPFPVRGAVRLPQQFQLDPVELLDALWRAGCRSRRPHRRGCPGRSGSGGATRSASPPRAGEVEARPGRRGDQPPGPRPGRVLRPDEAGALLRRGVPDRAARGRRDVPVRGRAVPVAARRPGRRRAPAARGRERAHHRSRRLDAASGSTTLRAWTHEHWPDAVETHAWSAQDYVPHHALPYAGPILPGNDEIVVAGGYSKWGMTNAPAAALALAARLLDGSPPAWADVLRTYAPTELRGLPTAARDNAEVGLEMTRGWVGALAGRLAAPRRPHQGLHPPRRRGPVERRRAAAGTARCTAHGSTRPGRSSKVQPCARCPRTDLGAGRFTGSW